MLQIQPSKEVVYEFIKQDDFRYVRMLGKTERSKQTNMKYWKH